MASLLGEKDDIISQLEEKVIENDRRMVDMQEELQGEMSENADLAHSVDVLQDEKQQLQTQLDSVERTILSLKDKVSDLEEDNSTLRQQLEKLR
jgi:septal ring factor EnvC (AmiA/AmiB activator)